MNKKKVYKIMHRDKKDNPMGMNRSDQKSLVIAKDIDTAIKKFKKDNSDMDICGVNEHTDTFYE